MATGTYKYLVWLNFSNVYGFTLLKLVASLLPIKLLIIHNFKNTFYLQFNCALQRLQQTLKKFGWYNASIRICTYAHLHNFAFNYL